MANPIMIDGREMSVAEFQASDGLRVIGSLYLWGTGITALPEGLDVSWSLDLSGTGITFLSKGLRVGSTLDLRGTRVTSLPPDLYVGKSIDPRGTGIKPIGKDWRGYEFFAVRLATGPRVIAGCRNFSPDEAREHWRDNPECLALAEKCIAALGVV